jgi:hypothetical protein
MFRVTEEEKQIIEKKADDAGFKEVATYLREYALKGKVKTKKIRSDEEKQMYLDLKGAVNNLNQIAKHLNQGGADLMAERNRDALAKIRKFLNNYDRKD